MYYQNKQNIFNISETYLSRYTYMYMPLFSKMKIWTSQLCQLLTDNFNFVLAHLILLVQNEKREKSARQE